jgi:hypothetical protein
VTNRRTVSPHRRSSFGGPCVVASNDRFLLLGAVALAMAFPVYAQDQLSLRDIVQVAVKQNKALQASRASVDEARISVRQARAGMLPTLNHTESLTRSNNPVLVFSSLATQLRMVSIIAGTEDPFT